MDDDYDYLEEEHNANQLQKTYSTNTESFDQVNIQEIKKKRGRKPKEINDDIKEIKVKEFDIHQIPPNVVSDYSGVKIVVIGKAGTGKSTLVQSIIASKMHLAPVIQIYNGTEDSSGFYGNQCAPILIHDKLDYDAMAQFAQRQKYAIKYLSNPWAIQVIDDCADDPSQLRHPLIQSYYKNGRHWKMIHIMCLQYSLDIIPGIRSNIDYTFILRENGFENRKKLYKNYVPNLVTFEEFCALMDACTEDYSALVIKNQGVSNKSEDCIFYYKADPFALSSSWKYGHPTTWIYNDERYNPDFVPNLLTTEISTKKKKGNKK